MVYGLSSGRCDQVVPTEDQLKFSDQRNWLLVEILVLLVPILTGLTILWG
jgi:hypothetical protein